MRDRYETQEDRDNEKRVVSAFCKPQWLVPLKREDIEDSRLDFELYRPDGDGLVGFAEVKCRDMVWGQYPDIMLSESKWIALKCAVWLQYRAYFIVEDKTGEIRVYERKQGQPDLDVVVGGRTKKTRDQWDVEPVVHIPLRWFSHIQKPGSR